MSSLSGAHSDASSGASSVRAASTGAPADAPAAELLRQAQFGDRSAFGQVVTLFQDRLYNAILRMVGDTEEARDLVQETFTRALARLDSFRGDAQPYTWLFRIAVNLTISQLRKVQRHRTFSLDRPGHAGASAAGKGNGRASPEGEDQASALLDRIAADRGGAAGGGKPDGPHEQVEKRERDQQVLAALGRLDAEYRAVLVMRDIEGFDYQQMAVVLDLPLGTLKSRLFRARLALRDELKPYFEK